jgi:hypothetical protein
MPVGTAERKLRKAVIHELARQAGKNICRWCSLEISDPDEFALIHVEDWEEFPDRYFDLGNVALSHASCAAARGGRRQGEESEMRIEVSVEDAHGNRLPGARHDGELYVAGKRDERYQVRVRNRTGKRVLVVTTVDGRNVNTGDVGDHTGPGHVLDPHQSWVFTGWRTSDDQVAAFRLGSKSDAYSSQLGSKQNVGVIGVAVFEEKAPDPQIITIKETQYVPLPYIVERPAPRPWGTPYVTWTTAQGDSSRGGFFVGSTSTVDLGHGGDSSISCSIGGDSSPVSAGAELSTSHIRVTNDSNGAAQGSSKRSRSRKRKSQGRQELGTEFGEELHSSVISTSFVRDTDDPCEVHAIRYDSREALKRRGIDVRRPSRRQEAAPSPFPRNDGYCEPPPRRRAHKGR